MKKTVGKPPKGAEGVITRGKTARNRLRRVDTFALLYTRECLTASNALFLDLGYGEEAITTLESAQRFRKVNPQLPVVGVEIDPERVAAAKPFEDDFTSFRLGGFNLPQQEGEQPTVIRAFNVLRQYTESDVLPAWQTLGKSMADGGLLIEGTSDPFGRIWTANLIRNRGGTLFYEGFLFSTNFRTGFSPELFQPYLTKNFIHQMQTGSPIDKFLSDWKAACNETIAMKTWGLRQWFQSSAETLSGRGHDLLLQSRFLQKGFLLWRWHTPLGAEKELPWMH
jgi:hypothetical protein